MARKIVMLDYTFLFDPTDTWQHLYQFQKSFTDFLKERGMQGEIVANVDGGRGRTVLLIEKIEENLPKEEKASKPVSVKDQVRNMKGKANGS